MKKHSILIAVILWVFCLNSQAFAANGDSDNSSAASTSSSQESSSISQMQAQINQMQAKQDQEASQLDNGGGSASDRGYSQSGATSQITNRPPFKSNFEYPFQQSKIKESSVTRSINDSAFVGAVQQAMPLTPTQIHRLKQLYNSAQFAAAAPAGTPPKPVATSLYVNLSPGASPPAIRLSEGFVTSLVFLDSTGAPWPIEAYDLGNPDAFNIAWNKKGNILMVQAKTLYTYGNLAIRLKGLNTPVMLTLIPGQKIVDYRTDVTVPGYGPDAKSMPINSGLPPQAAPVLLNVLDGVPPQGSKQLNISKSFGQAWLLNGKMYIRTHYTLLSPGWLATMSSADGTNAYELQQTPMLLMSKNGKVEHVKIGGL